VTAIWAVRCISSLHVGGVPTLSGETESARTVHYLFTGQTEIRQVSKCVLSYSLCSLISHANQFMAKTINNRNITMRRGINYIPLCWVKYTLRREKFQIWTVDLNAYSMHAHGEPFFWLWSSVWAVGLRNEGFCVDGDEIRPTSFSQYDL